MHGSRRVITFCLLTAVLPTILIVLPLYLRNFKYADVMYPISDSDVIQIHKGQSSIFCEKHYLKMNTTFNAFQMSGVPEISDKRKHIRLKKSMNLPDDTLEYWGFYLLKGATVELKACSRYEGSKILVVKGNRILDTCGILEGYKYKKDPPLVENQGRVLVTLQSPKKKENAEIIRDDKDNEILLHNKDTEDTLFDNDKINYFTRSNRTESKLKKIGEHDRRRRDDKDNEILLHNKDTEDTLFDNDKINYFTRSNRTESRLKKIGEHDRRRRDATHLHNPKTILDTGVHHGGNANNTAKPPDSSVSSFENNLYDCYHDNTLMTNYFPYSIQCNSTNYLESTTTLKVVHEVIADGYYYYIFYSDNDFVKNDIHAVFDIHKPTFQYANISESKVCVNKTECEFDVGFFSDELVIVELPTKDGLQNDEEDMSILISKCRPRVSVYIIFPISVLLLVLLFAFL